MRSPAREPAAAGIAPAFWPSLGTLALALRYDRLIVRDDLGFDATRGLHRARLPSSTGEAWLTLPVRGAAPRTPVREITLAPAIEWAPRAMRAIEHAFLDTPFFEHYRCDLARLLFRGWTRLVDLDVAMLRFLVRAVGLHAEVLRASACTTRAPLAGALVLDPSVSERSAIEVLFELGRDARDSLAPSCRPGRPRRVQRPGSRFCAPPAQAAATR